jgi:hypothetical protein
LRKNIWATEPIKDDDWGKDLLKMDERINFGMDLGRKGLVDLLKGPKLRFNEDSSSVPQAPGVYLVYEGDDPIYLGSSVNIRRRLFSQLFRNNSHYFASEMVDQKFHNLEKYQDFLISRCTVQWLATDSSEEAHWLERFVAGVIRPKYNGGTKTFSAQS